jgi:hypothetical protein
MQKMTAEVVVHPDDINRVIDALHDRGFDVEVLDWIDDHTPAMWLMAEMETELDADGFFDLVHTIVTPLRGCIIEAGLPDATEMRGQPSMNQ